MCLKHIYACDKFAQWHILCYFSVMYSPFSLSEAKKLDFHIPCSPYGYINLIIF
jgi:hypothetical protein